ncbi:MAG: TIGR02757 family protein [Elusimicrobiales bacterium]|nr:TIGR02757 family protein [Elusimicrobiales bacterium]
MNKTKKTKDFFERIYLKYTNKNYLFSDPIIFPWRFKEKTDIEIAALISSSLSYGNVKQIHNILEKIFFILKIPSNYLKNTTDEKIKKDFKNIKHRFTTGKEVSHFLIKLKYIYILNKDMESVFLKFYNQHDSIDISYTNFILNIFGLKFKTLIPNPQNKSAMKRFNMFLRWMVRKDNIDFGIWKNISTTKLIYPLDTHIHKFALKNNITSRKDSSIITAIEITNFFKKLNSKDPVKYDFAISRLGILKSFEI